MTPLQLYARLYRHYGDPGWWPADTPYEIMVGAILTQNTNWSNVEKALANLKQQLTPQGIQALSLERLSQLIKPAGFFNQKARYLKNLTAWWAAYDYCWETAQKQSLEKLRSELLALKGVGPETADSILLYAFNRPVLVIDAYTRRLLSRIGAHPPAGYEALRLRLEAALPASAELFKRWHALVVIQSKNCCRRQPLCHSCPLQDTCRTGIAELQA